LHANESWHSYRRIPIDSQDKLDVVSEHFAMQMRRQTLSPEAKAESQAVLDAEARRRLDLHSSGAASGSDDNAPDRSPDQATSRG
jgi:hypothetical protein